jgi:DNA-binding NtrC family response regulator
MTTTATDNIKLPRADHGSVGSRRVLVVDDQEAVLFAYRELLTEEGLDVDVCKTLDEVVALMGMRAYAVVITDLRLAGTDNVDGMSVLQCVSGLQPNAKLILVTGHGSAEIEQRALELGASAYFEKPVTPSVILDTLRNYVNGEQARQ